MAIPMAEYLAQRGDQRGLRIMHRREGVKERVKDRLPKNLTSYEARIDNLHRRIKKITDNPDPTKPAANKVRYELESKSLTRMLDAWKTGNRPFGGLGGSMGFESWNAVPFADRASPQSAKKYFNIMERQGFNANSCDRTIAIIPLIMTGDYPPPDVMFTINFECYPLYLAWESLANLLGIPLICLDRPPVFDEKALGYVARQIQEEIDYLAEAFPGHKLDWDHVIENQQVAHDFWQIQHDLYELRKRKPCPISGREAFRETAAPGGDDKYFWLQYWRDYRDQLYESAETGNVPSRIWGVDEKLRLMWAVSGPFFYDPFTFLNRLGVSVPVWTWSDETEKMAGREPTVGDERPFGRKLTPLEEMARGWQYGWGDRSHYFVNSIITTCQDLELDGIVYFKQTGCSPTMPLGGIVSERAERELGIPTIEIEARQLDQRGFNPKDLLTRLVEFSNVCLARKHLPPLTKKELEKAGYDDPAQFYTAATWNSF